MGLRTDTPVYRFGEFELDITSRYLTKGGKEVSLQNRHMDVLLVLLAQAGRLVSKDELTNLVWGTPNVTDDAIYKAVNGLRDALGAKPDGEPYIQTQRGKGSRVTTELETTNVRTRIVSLDELAPPYEAFMSAGAALETMGCAGARIARAKFTDALRIDPHHPIAHIGLAMACLLLYESTRADRKPDFAMLAEALTHAVRARELNPSSGDAWSTLALVWYRTSTAVEAIKAARRAVELEPHRWRHHLRLAFVSWGDMRLHAALSALALCPGLALAHWLAATVFIAREAFGPAQEHIRAGRALQDAQATDPQILAAVGLHVMDGMTIAAQGDSPAIREAARDAILRELAMDTLDHIYGRECHANGWYFLGVLATRDDRRDEAVHAFREADALVPGHPLALVGLASVTGQSVDALLKNLQGPVALNDSTSTPTSLVSLDAATVHAAILAVQGHPEQAAQVYHAGFVADVSASGWLLPIEPLLHVSVRREVWMQVLAAVRRRAS